MDSPSTIRALFQSGEALDEANNTVAESELPPPTSGQTFVVSEGGTYVSKDATGTANEIAINSTSTTITFAFDAAFFLKSYNTATAIRGRIEAAAKANPAIIAATIPLAKITGGGVDGSITVNAEGIVTAYLSPT